MKCDRCGASGSSGSFSCGSMFNTDQICMKCSKREKKHPRYEEARRLELQHVLKGDYNFGGVGLPPELRTSH